MVKEHIWQIRGPRFKSSNFYVKRIFTANSEEKTKMDKQWIKRLKKSGHLRPLFRSFWSILQNKNYWLSGIWTRIGGEEGEYADLLTATMSPENNKLSFKKRNNVGTDNWDMDRKVYSPDWELAKWIKE